MSSLYCKQMTHPKKCIWWAGLISSFQICCIGFRWGDTWQRDENQSWRLVFIEYKKKQRHRACHVPGSRRPCTPWCRQGWAPPTPQSGSSLSHYPRQTPPGGRRARTETRWLARFLASTVIRARRLDCSGGGRGGGSQLSRRPIRDDTSQKRISGASGGERSATLATPINEKIAAITLQTDPLKPSHSGSFARHQARVAAPRFFWFAVLTSFALT